MLSLLCGIGGAEVRGSSENIKKNDMPDDISDIADYYNSDPDSEHTRLDRHQLENDLTWRYFNQYLPAQGTILEIGAATGRYTLELAKRGYWLTSVDLSPVLLDECRKNLEREGLGFETIVVAGVEPAISADDESYNRLQGKQRQLWFDLLYEISKEESILGASRHLLYIGTKK